MKKLPLWVEKAMLRCDEFGGMSKSGNYYSNRSITLDFGQRELGNSVNLSFLIFYKK